MQSARTCENNKVPVWIAHFTCLRSASLSFFFFFFLQCMNSKITWIYYTGDKNHYSHIVAALFTHCTSTVYVFKNIKNESYDTNHTFKNYFATLFSVFSFSNNKFNPNRSKEKVFGTHFVELCLWDLDYFYHLIWNAKIVVVLHLNVWKNLGVRNIFSCEWF